MSIISNEHQSGSPFNCPGCFRARGECECPPRPEHQPGSPGAVDLDELDRMLALASKEPSSAYAPNSHEVLLIAPDLSAELRTLRARVGELKAALDVAKIASVEVSRLERELSAARKLAKPDFAAELDNDEWDPQERAERAEARAESAEARVAELESQLAAAREVALPNKPR